MEQTDRLIGTVLETIAQHPELRASTVVLLTSDHGGKLDRERHSDITEPENYRIPFLAWGTRVPKGQGPVRAESPAPIDIPGLRARATTGRNRSATGT